MRKEEYKILLAVEKVEKIKNWTKENSKLVAESLYSFENLTIKDVLLSEKPFLVGSVQTKKSSVGFFTKTF